MDDMMDKLREDVNDDGVIKMLSNIEGFHRVRLYNYIKDGKDYDDYVDDYCNGSLLIGRVVTNGINIGLVTRSAYWEDFRLYVICLDTFEEIADAPYDESLLQEWAVLSSSLDEYYNKKRNKKVKNFSEQTIEVDNIVDNVAMDSQQDAESFKRYAQYLHEYIIENG